jgi:hypothetical protein
MMAPSRLCKRRGHSCKCRPERLRHHFGKGVLALTTRTGFVILIIHLFGKNVTGFRRSQLLNKLADLIERDQQELAEIECLDNGKPVRFARSVASHRVVIVSSHSLLCQGTSTLRTRYSACAILLDGRIKFTVRLSNPTTYPVQI